jgi:hypothetical protein
VELRNDDNFMLEISCVFCHLHINGIGYTIYQGEQASDMTCIDDALRFDAAAPNSLRKNIRILNNLF